MNRYDKSKITQSFNRSSEIAVSDELRTRLERIAVLHLTAGNMTEYMVAMNSLSKLDTSVALSDAITKLADKVDAMDTDGK